MDFDLPYPSTRAPVMARNVVATSQPLAAQAGLRMLLQGGNAVDAALAAAIALTVVEPTGCGLGSDAFAILWDGERLHGLNASGRAPEAWTPERFAGREAMPLRGWDSVTVPGAVSAWVELSARFGRLPFAALFAPALDYAENGFAVTRQVARSWAKGAEVLRDQPGFAEGFLPDGRAPRTGEIWRNRPLAESLRSVAETRGASFYTGTLAERMVADAQAHGGALSMADLAAHRADWCGTVSAEFAGATLHEIPPNGQGIAACMALGILGHTGIEGHPVDSVMALHLQIEAVKLALADAGAHLADPAHMRVTPGALLDPDYLSGRAALIRADRAMEGRAGAPTLGGTVYLSAADASGMMVSFIQSNYEGFGSGVVVPGTGIHLQNRGYGFVTEPGHPNAVGPGKRPFHTIIPGFLMRDGAPLMSFGVMGGPMQAQGHVQMAVRTVLFGQNPQAASDAPRWRFMKGRHVAVEATMREDLVAGLSALGHEVTREDGEGAFGFGGAQLIWRGDAGYVAGSDHRKDGMAVGF